jgi:hydrogenase maturation protease
MTPRILVAGIGNIFLGDDAFGCEVALRMMTHALPENIRVVDFGIRGLDLVFTLLDGYDQVILIDAVPRGKAPGTLYTIEPDLDSLGPAPVLEGHSMDPARVLAVARSMGAKFRKIVLAGCEPESPEPVERIGLSQVVRNAVAPAVVLVEELIGIRKVSKASGGD